MKNNIILIGMPGSGKSTVGVILAKKLGYSFVDTDLIISKMADKPLQDIIDNEGLEAFSKLEAEAGENVDCNKTVIATGGSMVLCPKAMENLKNIGTVIYLKVPIDELESRLVNFKTRGIVMEKGETIRDILHNRKGLYEQYADIVINETHNSHMAENIDKILDSINIK